jgi:predicted amidohydrolase YtcJ
MTPAAFLRAFQKGRMDRRLRIVFCPEVEMLGPLAARGLQTGHGDGWLRFGGVKLFSDGSIGAGNAALSTPYSAGGLGALNYEDETLRKWIHDADQAGWQTITHAIGDRAIEQVLRVHGSVALDPALRHRIEHFELPNDEQIERTAAGALCVCVQPNFTANWSGPGGLYDERLGSARDRRSNPLRLLRDAHVPLAFGSDGMPPGPLYGLHAAVNAPFELQRVTLDDALDGYTHGGATFEFEEDEKGSLDPGMLADLVVLDRNPYGAPERLADRAIEMTFVGGQLVYSRDREA